MVNARFLWLLVPAMALGAGPPPTPKAPAPAPAKPAAAPAGKAPAAQQQAAADPVLRALRDELARAQQLKMEKMDRPYHLSASVNDSQTFNVSASFGALVGRGGGRDATTTVDVRVGDPSLDNTNFADRDDFSFLMRLERGGGADPAEPDYDALRRALWMKFDDAYKSAVGTIAKKRAFLETRQVRDRPPDYGPAKTISLLLPRETVTVSEERWTALVKRASAAFRGSAVAQVGEASFRSELLHQTLVTSDPAEHRFGEQHAIFNLRASGQAADGMEVEARYQAIGRTEKDLPPDEELLKTARALAARVDALAKAPVAADDYVGPVLFVGRAAATFFLRTVGDPLSQPRSDLGDARSGRLVERLGKHVAVKQLTVRDDPTQKEWRGRPLLGHFPVDDDSVAPVPITLIDQGLLKTYFMSRIPTDRIRESNGHARAGQGSVGNLFVETSDPTPRALMKKKLVELAQEEDLEYGLMVEEFDDLGEGRGFGGGSSNVLFPTPLLVWRVYLDGREELERGTRFKPSTFRLLKEIVQLGDDPGLTNAQQRGQHVSVVAPSVLVRVMEAQKQREEFERPPTLARPSL